ncbi:MAG: CapA family protein [Desulfobacterales bacterium]|nr:CapA family protein [Desulfobacterales bacterium]
MKIRFCLSVLSIILLLNACSSKDVKPEKTIVKKDIRKDIVIKKKIVKSVPAKKKKTTVWISGVGDLMLGTNYPKEPNYLPPDDGKNLLKEATGLFKGSDIIFGNLEGPLLNGGKGFKNCKKCFSFKVPEHYVNHLVKAGFNLLSLANNHAGDFGPLGRERTSQILLKNRIEFAGTEKQPYTTFTRKGIKYGFCAFAPNFGTPDLRNIENAISTVKKLSKVSDIVIVSFHGGAEGDKNRNVTRKPEFFYGENRGNVYEFAHKVIDAGADVVFGHGPHIVRAIELYKGRFIAYSLGNFCTYARFNLLDYNGVAPIIKLNTYKNGQFIEGKIIPMLQAFKKGPALDKTKRAIKEIIELTTKDFPETNIIIDKLGNIKVKGTSNNSNFD